MAAITNSAPIQLTLSEIKEQNGDFKGKFNQALKDGFFFVEIPEHINKWLGEAKSFGNSLRTNQVLKELKLGERIGYQERFGTQAVSFVAKKHQWEQVYPKAIVELAQAMDALAIEILKTALSHCGVSKDLWSEATGKLTEDKGCNVFSFNHYKPGSEKMGLIPHKDMGWITVLFIDKAGLEFSKDLKTWTGIFPKEGYFVINFGRAFELLINSVDKLRASVHQVHKLNEERLSFGVFINHNEGTQIYQLNSEGKLEALCSYQDYENKCFSEFLVLQKELQG